MADMNQREDLDTRCIKIIKMPDNLSKLKGMLDLINEGLTKKDFLSAFEGVLNFVKKIKERNDLEMEKMEGVFASLRSDTTSSLKELKKKAMDYCEDEMKKMYAEHEKMMEMMTDKIASVRDGRDGVDGLPAKDGKDGSPDTSGQIRDKLETLKGEDRLDRKAIRGLEDGATIVDKGLHFFGGGRPIAVRGLGVTVDKNVRFLNFTGSGVTSVARSADGVTTVTISASGGGTVVSEEAPTDSGDHLNFTLAHTPLAGTFRLYRGGSRQMSIGATPDFTRTGTALALIIALDTANGEVLLCEYEY